MTDVKAGVDRAALLKDLKRQVAALEGDLRARTESVDEIRVRLEAEYRHAREARRTAAPYGAWRDERVTQSAAAWVLACVFVRFCEDNGLIDEPFIAGPGERLAEAEARHEAFFRDNPTKNNRDWLFAAFDALAAANDTAAGLFDEAHNPLWDITPGYEAATELLSFWRRWGAEGEIRYDFTDPEWDTRFLGDLYQDLSEHARKTYALLQTPEFVEEFILDLTLEPAVSTDAFGLNPVWKDPNGEERRGLRTIDPACGSGHFLLGIFHRLFAKWRAAEPGTDVWTLVRRSLESVHGCDKNPYAVSIARFRLLVAAMRAAGAGRLKDAPAFPINVAVGDSLLHGRDAAGIQTDLDTLFAEMSVGREEGAFAYSTEDVWEYAKRVDLLGRGSYHVVVGNPPYITVKDKQEKENYKKGYDACIGQYALSVPFAQRLFGLAIKGAGGMVGGGGFVGQITANSFMKREFGKKLIEDFFWERAELSHVIDTSGAYIPGHGTPTVILVGRNRVPSERNAVRAVLGLRGEPQQPTIASQGTVWQSIVNLVRRPGEASEWVSVDDLRRTQLADFPWSLSGGGAGALMQHLNDVRSARLGDRVENIGFCAVTREDDAYLVGRGFGQRRGFSAGQARPILGGGDVRDWNLGPGTESIFPYSDSSRSAEGDALTLRELWPNRTLLKLRKALSGTQEEQGLAWYEYSSFSPLRYWAKWLISFPFVSTHNHFALRRNSEVFIRTAPVIRLPDNLGEDEHLELLGVLNSATACFWLKQVSHDKGSQGVNEGFKSQEWERFYEFTGTKLQEFPLPQRLPLELSRELDVLAQELAGLEPNVVCQAGAPSRALLDEARADYVCKRNSLIAQQEELDWQVYGLYGLLSASDVGRSVATTQGVVPPEVALGERAFEIVLARKVAAGEAETAWFTRHGSTPVTEIPAHWPDWYRDIVQARIDIINARKDIALIERPECKRRWSAEPWEKKERTALRNWLLDRCEASTLWSEVRDGLKRPRPMTVNYLADQLSTDEEFVSVAALYASDHLDKPDLPLAQVLTEVIADEHVPYLAAMRYKDSGLRKRADWEEVWQQQREEDRTGQRLNIPVPPKYTSADFARVSFWSNRGKLDVPKERFISYPEAGPDSDSTLMLGWAGWDHKDQAQALFELLAARTTRDGWSSERIVPLLAGLDEVMPWVKQWHGEYDDEWGDVPADELEAEYENQLRKHQASAEDLKAWRPVRKTRGRKAAAKQPPSDVE
ncbi:BREX-2 system adenine-specific DNA-methyltransferase PglX [Streptomyces sp. ME02-8801-2C]|uniref:BREX-2 system adenine-specific DNA-methyltransferase PglX n=1 Tax=Streptomyces sp. ME02-8801-2C TaxID=3028680 RepID=UPI0029A36E5A|nr:BREX-2 system adenine-specific DNA-methyltransferase PglX [Streptomyces sp. ME02-8801-2C]MDX3450853.1 BREX-2 system adenine-specific DNA-methyltransferase PglX [Streptomyces sp. ME02-8801-2C]